MRGRAPRNAEGEAAAKPKTTIKRTRKPAAKEDETGGEQGNKE